MIEFACDSNSLIGQRGPLRGIEVIRLTKEYCDLLTKDGLKKALKTVRDNPGCSMHASIPCSPWSSWTYLNLHRLGNRFKTRLLKDRKQSLVMLHNFKIVAREIKSLGGCSALNGLAILGVGN